MPGFDYKSCHQYWFEYKDPMIYRVVTFMEGVENWTLDYDTTLEPALKKLGETMDEIGNIDLKQEDDFIKVAAFVRASRALRLLQCMDTAYPGAASKLLMHAEEVSRSSDDTPGLFLRRNIVFERLRLLARVFAPERFQLVLKALEQENV